MVYAWITQLAPTTDYSCNGEFAHYHRYDEIMCQVSSRLFSTASVHACTACILVCTILPPISQSPSELQYLHVSCMCMHTSLPLPLTHNSALDMHTVAPCSVYKRNTACSANTCTTIQIFWKVPRDQFSFQSSLTQQLSFVRQRC